MTTFLISQYGDMKIQKTNKKRVPKEFMCLGKIKSLISFSKLFLGIKMNNFVVLLIYMSILLAS